MRKTVHERFFEKVDRRGDHCWPWMATRLPTGYGLFRIGPKKVGAHRASWELHHGAIPLGMHVLHRCDNPGCVNPSHLFIGDAAANSADMVRKGRQHRAAGTRNSQAKLTPEEVAEIRRRYATGSITMARLGAAYGVTHVTISHIVNGRRWGVGLRAGTTALALAALTACNDPAPVAPPEPDPFTTAECYAKLHVAVENAIAADVRIVGILLKSSRDLNGLEDRAALEAAGLEVGTTTRTIATGRIDARRICDVAALPFVAWIELGGGGR